MLGYMLIGAVLGVCALFILADPVLTWHKNKEGGMIKRIIRGAKGHPGTGVLILYMLGGLAIGLNRSSTWQGALIGGGVMLVFAGLPWLLGAYERGDIVNKEEK